MATIKRWNVDDDGLDALVMKLNYHARLLTPADYWNHATSSKLNRPARHAQDPAPLVGQGLDTCWNRNA